MKYLRRFDERVTFHDLLTNDTYQKIKLHDFEVLEYFGLQEDITENEDKILNDSVKRFLEQYPNLKVLKVKKESIEIEIVTGKPQVKNFVREYQMGTGPVYPLISFRKYDDDYWLIEAVLPKGNVLLNNFWACDGIEGVHDWSMQQMSLI